MYRLYDPTIALAQEHWLELQRTAKQYRLHRSQSQDSRSRRTTLRRRRVS